MNILNIVVGGKGKQRKKKAPVKMVPKPKARRKKK